MADSPDAVVSPDKAPPSGDIQKITLPDVNVHPGDKPYDPNSMGIVVGKAPKRDAIDPNSMGKVVGAAPKRDIKAPEEIKDATKWLSNLSREPDVDYKPGLGFDAEQAVKRADNDDEVRLELERRFGKDSAKQDHAGNWYVVKPTGEKVAVFGDESGLPKRAATSLLSVTPQLIGQGVGAAGGGALGTLAGPFAPAAVPAGAVVGAGIGAAAGKGLGDLYKHFTSTYSKTPEQERDDLAREALWSMGGEVGGRTLSMLGRVALKPSSVPWIGVTPEMMAREADLRARGIVPTIEQVTGGDTYKILEYHQKLSQLIWHNPAERKNVEAINRQFMAKLSDAGVAPDKVEEVLRSVVRNDLPMTEANSKIYQAVNDYKASLAQQAETSAKTAKEALDKDLASIDKALVDPKIELSDAVSRDIEAARAAFRRDAGQYYQLVDELAGEGELVDTRPIKEEVQGILDSLPKTASTPGRRVQEPPDARGIRHMADVPGKPGTALGVTAEPQTMAYVRDMLRVPDRITFSDAQRIRSFLLDATRDPTLTPGVGIKELNQIRSSVDAAIDGVAVIHPELVDALRTANSFYREGIQKFEDTLANRLVKEAGTRGSVEPDLVMESIVRTGKVDQAKRIMNFLRPDTRAQLSREYFDDILGRVRDPVDPDHVLGKKMMAVLNNEKPMIEAVFGKEQADKMAKFARTAAEFDGPIPIKDLSPDTVGYYVQTMRAAQTSRDNFMSSNFMSALAKDGTLQDQAVDYLSRPGQVDRLRQALNSPIGSTVKPVLQQTVMQKILAVATNVSPDSKQLFTGSALKDELTRYGREYLTTLYGKETTDDLFRLGDSISNISTRRSGHAIGFVAGTSIMLHPFKAAHLSALVETYVMNRLFATPGFIKYLIKGYEGDSDAMKAVAFMARNAIRAATQESVPTDKSLTPPAFMQRNAQPSAPLEH